MSVNKVYQEWELLYEHNRDFQAAQCISLGVPVPEEPEYGSLTLVNGIWSKCRGPEFWSFFNSKGHDSCLFHKCRCQKKLAAGEIHRKEEP